MLPELLQQASLFHLLYHLDIDLAKQIQQKRCPYCNSSLHFSNYERKPRGGPENIPDEYLIRFSLCCSNKDCRRRALPASCRFMGRKIYWGCVVVVVMALKLNRPEGASARKVMELLGISRQTFKRWIEYFRDEFPKSSVWQRLRGRVISGVRDDELPGSLLNHFIDTFISAEKGLVACFTFLATGQMDCIQTI